MIKDLTQVKIGSLWNEGRGATFKEEIDAKIDFGPDIKLLKPLTSKLLLIRMKDSIIAIQEDLKTVAELVCSKCLKTFQQKVSIATAEREFLEDQPKRNYDPFEVFLINREQMSIDLTEMTRQEIILHFPMIPVCSKRCRGLCPGCQINLNQTTKHLVGCTRKELLETEVYKPFAQLKEMFKSSKK